MSLSNFRPKEHHLLENVVTRPIHCAEDVAVQVTISKNQLAHLAVIHLREFANVSRCCFD